MSGDESGPSQDVRQEKNAWICTVCGEPMTVFEPGQTTHPELRPCQMSQRKPIRIRRARTPGTCPLCGGPILIGQQIGAASWTRWAQRMPHRGTQSQETRPGRRRRPMSSISGMIGRVYLDPGDSLLPRRTPRPLRDRRVHLPC